MVTPQKVLPAFKCKIDSVVFLSQMIDMTVKKIFMVKELLGSLCCFLTLSFVSLSLMHIHMLNNYNFCLAFKGLQDSLLVLLCTL